MNELIYAALAFLEEAARRKKAEMEIAALQAEIEALKAKIPKPETKDGAA